MDDVDLEYDDEEEYDFVASYEWSRDHMTVDALEFAANIAEASAALLRQLVIRAGAQNNLGIAKRAMHQQAAQEIEKLTGGE